MEYRFKLFHCHFLTYLCLRMVNRYGTDRDIWKQVDDYHPNSSTNCGKGLTKVACLFLSTISVKRHVSSGTSYHDINEEILETVMTSMISKILLISLKEPKDTFIYFFLVCLTII